MEKGLLTDLECLAKGEKAQNGVGVVKRALEWEANQREGSSTSPSLCFLIQIPRITMKVS